MRKICFKAQKKETKEWVQGGYYLDPSNDIVYIIRWNSSDIGYNELIEVLPDTVCQYTGLLDKFGKRIWENDKVEVAGKTFTVKWSRTNARFECVDHNGMNVVDLCSIYSDILTVKGNTFDHDRSVAD